MIMRLAHSIVACLFPLTLAACSYKAGLSLATARVVGENVVVEVPLNRQDVRVIKERELYFSIIVVECADKSNRFPLQPSLDGKMIEGGNFPSTMAVTVYGTMPVSNFQEYVKPCVFLEGGGYFSGNLSSASIPVGPEKQN